MCANNDPMVTFAVCLHSILPHYHYHADVYESIELLDAYHVHSVECVSKIKSILSIIFHAMYMAMCIQLTHFSCDDESCIGAHGNLQSHSVFCWGLTQ